MDMDDLNEILKNAGLLKESDEAPYIPKYKQRLMEKNYELTPTEKATHAHLMDDIINLQKAIKTFLFTSGNLVEGNEHKVFNDLNDFLTRMGCPMALIKDKPEGPKLKLR